MRILIVDDSAVMRQMIKSMVAAPDDETAECDDGSSVIPAYEAFHPDWVLMDLRMSKTNGIASTRALKTLHPEARVAIVTNYGDQEFREEAEAAGADEYFLKDNLAAIRQHLKAQGS